MINEETLKSVLGKMLGELVACATFEVNELQGGTLGDVRLVEGIAEVKRGEKLPYKIVFKTQKKWERPGDLNSWRREYDFYSSGMDTVLPENFRSPKCYHAEINGDEIEIWMEYIEGVSGSELTIEMLEQAALEIGRFQGKFLKEALPDITNFGDTGYLNRDYEQWHDQSHGAEQLISENSPLPDSVKQAIKDGKIKLCDGKSFEYSYLRSDECAIPRHLKQMFFDIDDNMDVLFNEIAKLPVVLCHRDFWIENIIYDNGKIRLIDWDTSGWGYLGEDLVSLIADDYDFDKFEEACQKIIPAYYKGISEHMDISAVQKYFIREMILIKYGYRFVQAYFYAETGAERKEQIQGLQKIFEISTPG